LVKWYVCVEGCFVCVVGIARAVAVGGLGW